MCVCVGSADGAKVYVCGGGGVQVLDAEKQAMAVGRQLQHKLDRGDVEELMGSGGGAAVKDGVRALRLLSRSLGAGAGEGAVEQLRAAIDNNAWADLQLAALQQPRSSSNWHQHQQQQQSAGK